MRLNPGVLAVTLVACSSTPQQMCEQFCTALNERHREICLRSETR